jgi:hypothetical protein
MNSILFRQSIIEISISLIIGLLALTSCFIFVTKYGKRKYGIQKYNLSFAILKASILFSAGYLIQAIIQPLTHTYRVLLSEEAYSIVEMLWYSLLYFLYFFSIGFAYTFITIVLSLKMFTLLTAKFARIHEADEIRDNNLSVGIITGVVVIVMSLLLKDGLIMLIESLMPFTDIPKFIWGVFVN